MIDFEIAVEIRFACVLDVKFLDRIGGGGDRRGRFYLFILAWNLGVWVFGIVFVHGRVPVWPSQNLYTQTVYVYA